MSSRKRFHERVCELKEKMIKNDSEVLHSSTSKDIQSNFLGRYLILEVFRPKYKNSALSRNS